MDHAHAQHVHRRRTQQQPDWPSSGEILADDDTFDAVRSRSAAWGSSTPSSSRSSRRTRCSRSPTSDGMRPRSSTTDRSRSCLRRTIGPLARSSRIQACSATSGATSGDNSEHRYRRRQAVRTARRVDHRPAQRLAARRTHRAHRQRHHRGVPRPARGRAGGVRAIPTSSLQIRRRSRSRTSSSARSAPRPDRSGRCGPRHFRQARTRRVRGLEDGSAADRRALADGSASPLRHLNVMVSLATPDVCWDHPALGDTERRRARESRAATAGRSHDDVAQGRRQRPQRPPARSAAGSGPRHPTAPPGRPQRHQCRGRALGPARGLVGDPVRRRQQRVSADSPVPASRPRTDHRGTDAGERLERGGGVPAPLHARGQVGEVDPVHGRRTRSWPG